MGAAVPKPLLAMSVFVRHEIPKVLEDAHFLSNPWETYSPRRLKPQSRIGPLS